MVASRISSLKLSSERVKVQGQEMARKIWLFCTGSFVLVLKITEEKSNGMVSITFLMCCSKILPPNYSVEPRGCVPPSLTCKVHGLCISFQPQSFIKGVINAKTLKTCTHNLAPSSFVFSCCCH